MDIETTYRILNDAVRQHKPSLLIACYSGGYDSEPTVLPKQEAAGQRAFDWDVNDTPNLCAGCSKPEPRNEALDFVALQRMEW